MTRDQYKGLHKLIRDRGTIRGFTECIMPLIHIDTLKELRLFFTAYLLITQKLTWKSISGVEIVRSNNIEKEWPREGDLIAHLTSTDVVLWKWSKKRK